MNENQEYKRLNNDSLLPFALPAIIVSGMVIASFFLLSNDRDTKADNKPQTQVRVVHLAGSDSSKVDESEENESINNEDVKEFKDSNTNDEDSNSEAEFVVTSSDDKDENLDQNQESTNKPANTGDDSNTDVSDSSNVVGQNRPADSNISSSNSGDLDNFRGESSSEKPNSSGTSSLNNYSKYTTEAVRLLEADPNAHVNKDGNWYIIVQPGDNLTNISKKYGYSVDQLAQFNNIRDVNLIYRGSSIILPGNNHINKK